MLYLDEWIPEREREDTSLEFRHADKLFDADFDHVEDAPVKHTNKGETVGFLFCGLADNEERGIVFGGPELERGLGSSVEGMDVVFLCERNGIWSFESHLRVLLMVSCR